MWASVAAAALGLLTALTKWISSLFDLKRESDLRNQGRLEQQIDELKTITEASKQANEARDQILINISRVPESDSLPDDGFRRD